ncbi:MAG: hypothetical protein JXR95_07630 [Deltaproteobacteria bacterium]|nr:hypothetical protein [Deltaproteobacteria bacterium]
MLEEIKKKILEGLARGIMIERDGYNFYMMASSMTDDVQGKATFRELAEEEKKHEELLILQYKSLAEKGVFSEEKLVIPEMENDKTFFTPEFTKRAAQAHYEMSALSIGLQLELSTIEHYRKLFESTDDITVKSFFGNMVDWEKTHYDYLSNELNSIKNIYWADSGFAPF